MSGCLCRCVGRRRVGFVCVLLGTNVKRRWARKESKVRRWVRVRTSRRSISVPAHKWLTVSAGCHEDKAMPCVGRVWVERTDESARGDSRGLREKATRFSTFDGAVAARSSRSQRACAVRTEWGRKGKGGRRSGQKWEGAMRRRETQTGLHAVKADAGMMIGKGPRATLDGR
ncbi:hypothetical protein LZ30DRAFT_118061 [Colletotrichum cereale]|nr:hypothetical protein LZ30DRAFT_118061 [Colletotrichum cereale]